MKELVPCRLCGCDDIYLHRERPKCRQCGASQEFIAGHEAIEVWNRGPIDQEQPTVKPSKKVDDATQAKKPA